MNFYSYHVGDFRSGSIYMSQLERWLYRDLLDICYDTELPLPSDLEAVCRLVGARTLEQQEAIRVVLKDKFEATPDGYVNARAASEIAKFRKKSDSARAANRTRWSAGSNAVQIHSESVSHADQIHSESVSDAFQIHSESVSDADQMRFRSISDADQILTNNQEPITRKQKRERPPEAAGSPPRSPVGSRVPAQFPTDAEIAWCRQERPDLNATELADKFRDYWVGVPGAKGRKADWPATWRNFVRSERRDYRSAETVAEKRSRVIRELTTTTVKPEEIVIDAQFAALLG